MNRKYRLDLTTNQTVANSDFNFPPTDQGPVFPDIMLYIKRALPENGSFEFNLIVPELKARMFSVGYLKKSGTEVFEAVEECRVAWKQAVVNMTRPNYQSPFQQRWEFADAPELLASVAPELAIAGEKLFVSIFELECDEKLLTLAATLRELLDKPRCIAFLSEDFFIPWSMLYTQPPDKEPLAADGSNWEASGFWGYPHILHHSTTDYDFESRIKLSNTGDLPFSINFDDRLFCDQSLVDDSIPLTFGDLIKQHIKNIKTLALAGNACILRTKKAELKLALTVNRQKIERVLYFYCHGHGSSSGRVASTTSASLSLKDGEVTAGDFADWARRAPPTGALIMINACQGGQMTTLFYKSFAKQLLREGAVGLIGPQIDVPAVFASAYGELLLQQFLARSSESVRRLGPLMQSVNQTMWDTHKNPLGLVYSLYHGVNCFIDWPQVA